MSDVDQERERLAELAKAAKHFVEISLDPSRSEYIRENGRHGDTSPWVELVDAAHAIPDVPAALLRCGPCPPRAKAGTMASDERERLRGALEAVIRCEARFSLDPLEHAKNAVEHCREVARAALRERDTACEHCGSVIRRDLDGLCPVCRRLRCPAGAEQRTSALLRSEQPREVPEANAKLAKALRRMAEQVSPFRAQGLMQMAADVLERSAQPQAPWNPEQLDDLLRQHADTMAKHYGIMSTACNEACRVREAVKVGIGLQAPEPEPGELIAKVECPGCRGELEIMYGDDEGEIGILYSPAQTQPDAPKKGGQE